MVQGMCSKESSRAANVSSKSSPTISQCLIFRGVPRFRALPPGEERDPDPGGPGEATDCGSRRRRGAAARRGGGRAVRQVAARDGATEACVRPAWHPRDEEMHVFAELRRAAGRRSV